MTYTHLKVDSESKTKFRKLADYHNLTMLRLFSSWVDSEYKKQGLQKDYKKTTRRLRKGNHE